MPALSNEDLRIACGLVLDAYTRQDLTALVRDRLTLRLEWIVREDSFAAQVAELLDFGSRHRLTGRLIKEFADYPPSNPNKEKFRPLALRYPIEVDDSSSITSEIIGEAIGAFNAIPALPEVVRNRLLPFRESYQQAAKQMDVLRRYKRLHECLQVLQLKIREIVRSAENVAEDETEAGSLNSYADDLDEVLASGLNGLGIDEVVRALPDPGPELTWISSLRKAIAQLHDAADNANISSAEHAVRLLNRILDRDPIRIHGAILRQSETLPLPPLIFSLRSIASAELQSGAKQRLANGLAALEEIQLKLGLLIVEHTAWQNLDNSLRLALGSWNELLKYDLQKTPTTRSAAPDSTTGQFSDTCSQMTYLSQLSEDWPDVASKFAEVRRRSDARRRLDKLTKYATDIDSAVASRNFGPLCKYFEPFSQQALLRFVEVDNSLLRLADDLTRIGEPIEAVLEAIAS